MALYDRLHRYTSQSILSIEPKDDLDLRLVENGLLSTSNKHRHFDASRDNHTPKKSLNFWIHVVDVCNLACFYCYIPSLQKGVDAHAVEGKSFDVTNIQPVLERIMAYCRLHGIEALGLKFAGGEPTLNLGIVEAFCETALRLCDEIKITFGMITNGTLVTDRLLELLNRYQINVSISMDGVGRHHDSVRNIHGKDGTRHGTFDTVLSGLLRLNKSKLHPYVLYTVGAKNHADIGALSQICREERIGFRLSLIRLSVMPKSAVVDEISEFLQSFYSNLGRVQPTDMPIERFAKFSEWSFGKRKTLACSSGRSYFSLDERGHVSTCQMAMNRSYGDLRVESMDSIVERLSQDRSVTVLTEGKRRGGTCSRCEFSFVCAGACPQHTHSTYGAFEASSPWCQVYGRLLPTYVEAVARQIQRRFLELKVPTERFSALPAITAGKRQ